MESYSYNYMSKAIIYKIINDINDKIYVGQTWKTAQERFERHCAESRWKNTRVMPIVLAIKKYGRCHFQIYVLEELPDCTQSQLNDREVFWGMELNSLSPYGYNLKLGGANGIASKETGEKIGNANRGKKRSPETRERLRISHLGYKIKDSTKKKLSDINKGKTLSEDHKRKIGESNLGRKTTEQAKEKMRLKKLKYTYEVMSPDGNVLEIRNLHRFSIDNGLNPGHMNSIACGKKEHYKQWRVKKKEI